MVKSGPRTYAQRATDAAVIPGERAPVPPELEPAAAGLWVEIVNRLPADWFTAEMRPLLKEYCRHAMYAERFAQDVAAERAGLDALQATSRPDRATLEAIKATTHKLHELHRMHGFETDRLITLATKLRLTQQSRYFPDKAGSKSRSATPVGPRPWHDWGDESTPEN